MTDKEIIKALEYWKEFDKEIDILLKAHPQENKMLLEQREIVYITFEVFDLINRQQAEIERLQEELEIRNQKRASIFEISNAYERGRAEAIKEVEAKIHEKLHEAEMHGNFEPVVTREMFDSVVKEMEGEGR